MTNKGNPVLTESVDGILIITINRPQARNSINTATAEAIGLALDELDNKADLTAGIITGAGGFFCAGMDLKAFLAGEKPSIPVRGFAGIVEKPSNDTYSTNGIATAFISDVGCLDLDERKKNLARF